MKRTILLSLFLTILFLPFSMLCGQSLGLAWANQTGGSGADNGNNVTTDDQGNIYFTGYFEGTSDFDPDTSTLTFTASLHDAYVQKFDAQGNLKWAAAFGGSDYDYGHDVAVDNDGNVFVTGNFRGTADFDPGTGTFNLTAQAYTDGFIVKLDSMGQFLWAVAITGGSNEECEGIVADDSGNVYITGSYHYTTDFNPGPAVDTLQGSGLLDAFILKLDPAGNFVWVDHISSPSDDVGRSITMDDGGNILITGDSAGRILVQKREAQLGQILWSRIIQGVGTGSGFQRGYDIDSDHQDNVLVSGRYGGITDFDPGPGVSTATGNGGSFLLKLDSNGLFEWVSTIQGNNVHGRAVGIDAAGNAYVTGEYFGTVYVDPGINQIVLTATSVDYYLLKVTPQGAIDWTRKFGNGSVDCSLGLEVDALDRIVVTGFFAATVDFHPGAAEVFLTSNTSANSFNQVIHTCATDTSSEAVTACDSYTWLDGTGNTYNSSNSYLAYLENEGGCDSVANLDLTIRSSTSSSESVTACDAYTWFNGQTYTQSQFATDTLINAAGCDSVLLLSLFINQSLSDTILDSVCEPYFWPVSGEIYDESGVHSVQFTSSYGCDSVVTLSLVVDSIKAEITQQQTVLFATPGAASYRWLMCNETGLFPLAGETNSSFEPEFDGSFAVVTGGVHCIDTSDCFSFSGVGMSSLFSQAVRVYPNPARDVLHIEAFGNLLERVEVRTLQGALIRSQISDQELIISDLPAGVYLVDITVSGTVYRKKFIKL